MGGREGSLPGIAVPEERSPCLQRTRHRPEESSEIIHISSTGSMRTSVYISEVHKVISKRVLAAGVTHTHTHKEKERNTHTSERLHDLGLGDDSLTGGEALEESCDR